MLGQVTEKRYETKFNVTQINYNQIKHVVMTHPALFSKIYNVRNVNNIYFDTFDLNSHVDNVEGERDRRKVRIRWYGDLFGICKQPKLELKNKQGLLGWKVRYGLDDFILNKEAFFDYKKIIRSFPPNHEFHLLSRSLKPALLNTYKREYFLSKDGRYRITLDKKMKFYSINPISEHFKSFTDEQKTIVELKYNQDDIEKVDKITQFFPFRLTKNSKYVVGIDKLRKW